MGSGWGVRKSRAADASYTPTPAGASRAAGAAVGSECKGTGSCKQSVAQTAGPPAPSCAAPSDDKVTGKVWCNGVQTEKRNGKFWWADDSNAAPAAGDHFRHWTVEQVAEWVQTVQGGRFAGHAEKFRGKGVDGEKLPALTQESLKEMGVQDPKTRGILLSAISAEASFSAGALAVKPKDELARLAAQKEQASASPDEDEEERADASSMVLRTILGEEGKPDAFIDMVNTWRSANPTEEYSDEQARGRGGQTSQPAESRILVAARVRPVLADGPDEDAIKAGDFEALSVPLDPNARVVLHACGMRIDGVTPKVDHKAFRVHRALGQKCGERRVFEVVAPLVRTAAERRCHATVLCFGQTGSGKTHTVGHLARHISEHLFGVLGVTAVAFEAFELQGGAKGLLQLGAGHAFSLLQDSKPELTLFEGADGVVHVGGSSGIMDESSKELDPQRCAIARTPEELQAAFKAAEKRRLSLDTKRNKASSRTHAFYRFHVALPMSAPDAREGSLMSSGACVELVDLAGSESNKDSLFHDKSRVDGSAKINFSLMALNDCIRKTAQGARYVPFRSDRLTQLLRPCFVKRQDSLSGVATVLFIACVSPLASDTHHSVRTLTYTQQLTGINTAAGKARPSGKGSAKSKARLAKVPWRDPLEDEGPSPSGDESAGGFGSSCEGVEPEGVELATVCEAVGAS